MAADTQPDNALWDFSLSVYAEPEVEHALLHLQDETGLDVNLVLVCCYAGVHGARLTDQALGMLVNHAEAWRATAVEPLRALRRRLKRDVGAVSAGEAAEFRERVKALELEAERLQQDMLYRVLAIIEAQDGREAERRGLVRGNLAAYAQAREITLNDADKACIEQILEASIRVRGVY